MHLTPTTLWTLLIGSCALFWLALAMLATHLF